MGVYHDHDMCLTRFTQQCPSNLTDATDGKVEVVDYSVGDLILFNDFVCHWVDNYSTTPRLALILNTDRADLPSWSNWLVGLGSRLFVQRKMGVFLEGSKQVCNALAASGVTV